MPQANGGQNIFFTVCYRIYALIKPEKVKYSISFSSLFKCDIFMQLTQSKAASECCKYGLKLASLDSPLELQCIKQFLSAGALQEIF